MGYDIQGAFYRQAVQAHYAIEAEFYLVTIETSEPYALSVVGLDPAVKWLGHKKCEEGLRLWKECVTSNQWPGFPNQTCWATLPAYLEKQWLEYETRENI